MSYITAVKNSRFRGKKQRGFTIIEIGVVIGIITILGLVASRFLAGSAQTNEWERATQLAATTIPQALQREMAARNTYARLTNNAGGKLILTSAGVTAETPWRSAWTVSTAGSATAVSISFPCTGAGDVALTCTEVRDRITQSAVPMITSAAVTGTGATSAVVVTYGRPRV